LGTVNLNANGEISSTGDQLVSATMVEVLAAIRTVISDSVEFGLLDFNDELNVTSTFIYQENGASADDILIQLTGTTGIEDISNAGGDANTLFII
tara:strand:- start:272 stop:556 length:285 start_codon:yes stop_codon:yes gene_type:complete